MTYDNRAQDITQRGAFAVRLDIDNDPIRVWTGPGVFAPTDTGDLALDGQTFESVGGAPIIQVSPVTDGPDGVSQLSLSLGGADLNKDAAIQFLRDRRSYQGKRAYVWECLLDENYTDAFARRFYTGIISHFSFQDGDDAVITCTLDRDIRLLRNPPRKMTRQREIWPGDTFADYAVDAANKPYGPGKETPPPTQYNPFPEGFRF